MVMVVVVRSGLLFRLGLRLGHSVAGAGPPVLVHQHVVVEVAVLFLDGRALVLLLFLLILVIFVLVFLDVTRCANGGRDRTRSVERLRSSDCGEQAVEGECRARSPRPNPEQ